MGYRLLTILIGLMCLTSCNNDVPVVDVKNAKPVTKEVDLTNTNRMIAQEEGITIERFATNRGWKMEDIGSGIKLMKTAEGHGETAFYDDTVSIRYTVRNIEDKVVYADVEDTVVVGRLKPCRGLDFALRHLNEGCRATVILPSEEAYGVPGDGDRIGKRWILIYDLNVCEIKKLK